VLTRVALTLAMACAVLLLAGCGSADDPAPDEETSPLPGDPSPAPSPGQGGGGDRALPAEQWTALPEAPQALSEVAAAAFGGQLWTAGGLTAGGDASGAVQIFDPAFATWDAGPELPEPVHHAALVSSGAELYLLGGYVGSGFDTPTAAVHRLDPASGQWALGPSLPDARAAGAAVWDGDRIVYGGGVGGGGPAGEVFALEGERWVTVGALSEPREHLAAAADGQGRVWFLAGRTGGLDTNLGTVDLVEGDAVSRIGEVPTPRGGVAGFWSPGTGACVVGGESPEGTFADVECVDVDGEVLVLPALGQARHGLGAAVVEGIAYAALGGTEPGLSVSGTVEGLRLPASPGS